MALTQLVKTVSKRLPKNPVSILRVGCKRFEPVWPEEERDSGRGFLVRPEPDSNGGVR